MTRPGLAAVIISFAALTASTPGLANTPGLIKGDRALGEYLSNECVACHQISGKPVGGIPPIVGVPEDQFLVLMHAYRDKLRDNEVMRAITSRLSDGEIASLAAYFSSIKPKQ
jgi:cytochrome c553